ncbi:MAG: lipid A deacylase LpxR family protein [Steroidobacteraceae bacterium]
MRTVRQVLLAASLAWAPFAIGQAGESVPSSGEDPCTTAESLHWRGGTVRFENDLLTGTDRNYTNGVSLALVSRDIEGRLRPECLPPPLGLYTRFLGRLDPGFRRGTAAASTAQNVVVRVGQAMYTPADESRTDLIENDRPYAGLSHLGLAWNRRVHAQGSAHEMLDSRELTLGVIGPWSLAEKSQHLIHDLRGIERFRGWDHQLRNEPAVQLAMERKFKPYAAGAVRSGWTHDAIGSYALRVGNIETAAGIGLELRTGWNIPNDFGSYPIRPAGENRPPSAAAGLRTSSPRPAAAPRPGVHAFVNLEATAVAWHFSLDGNLMHVSHHVTRRPWVAQAALGVSGQWLVSGRGLRLALMRVWRTSEFEEQAGHHAFGSIALSMEY